MTRLEEQGRAAKQAARVMAAAGSGRKDAALRVIADALEGAQEEWLAANAEDLREARENGITDAMYDRLRLTPERIRGIAEGVRTVTALPDPVGALDKGCTRPNGLRIERRRVPLGVIAIIYEARPNVTVDAAALCMKAGNVCILRGGKEAFRSNQAAVRIMRSALREAGLPEDAVQLVEDTSRESANELMHLNEYVDVLIPRGGAGLIRAVARNASVPVIRTGEGVCHIYIDREADLPMGAEILYNAKCSRPSVCNAVECVLLHEASAEAFLREAVPLLAKKKVELRCDAAALGILSKLTADHEGGIPVSESCLVRPAEDADWDMEYGDYILAVHVVRDAAEAMDFIAAHGTGHSECIVTNNYFTAQQFLDEVDAAAVYVNAATRFTDGGEFGLGAEIGISIQKLHARGPMGLEELTSTKYVVYGQGQVR